MALTAKERMEKEQAAFDANAVADMIRQAEAKGKLIAAVIAFGNHRETGCTANESVVYALADIECE